MFNQASPEILLTPLGTLCFIACTAHSEFQKTPRRKAKSHIDYAIALAEQRGYPKAEHLRQLFKQPDVGLIVAEIEELAQYVDVFEVFEHFGIRMIPAKG